MECLSIIGTLFSCKCLLSQQSCKYVITVAVENSTSVTAFTRPSTADYSCQSWKDSREPLFQFLRSKTLRWHNLPLKNLRHIHHHLTLLTSILDLRKTRQFCLQWNEFTIYTGFRINIQLPGIPFVAPNKQDGSCTVIDISCSSSCNTHNAIVEK